MASFRDRLNGLKIFFLLSAKTLSSTLEFSNIDAKLEFKKSQRQLDLKGVVVSGQVLIVLSQNRNNYNIECYADQQSEISVNIKKDAVS